MKRVNIDALSLRPLLLQVFYGESKLAIATGFCWEKENRKYLITNWHVASGLNPFTSQPLFEHGGVPDRLVVSLHRTGMLGKWGFHEIELYDKQQRPVWLEHSQYRSKVDVVAVPLSYGSELESYAINSFNFDDIRVEVSQDVFIIGYPSGISSTGGFPIWKRGSIASEPGDYIEGLPKILIDSATREGMSGSPVIAQFVGYHYIDPPMASGQDWFGMGRCFLGVYSGRLPGRTEFDAQLGIVWKQSVIEEIITQGVRPE